MIRSTTAGRWFMRVMWLGIFANLAVALPTMAAPDLMTSFSRLPAVTPDLWARFSGMLLVLLSVFYMPAAIDPDRYRATAWFAVGSRLAGVLFFAGEPATYLMLGLFDLVFFVPLALLLWFAIRSARSLPAAPSAGSSTASPTTSSTPPSATASTPA
jgi:hypothetical protein